MSTLIFGAGAIGQWLGALLHSSGSDVQIHVRPRVAESISELGGIVLNDGRPVPVKVSSTDEEIRDREFKTVICTVKTYAVGSALRDLKESGVRFDELVSFQNGWGTDEKYVETFPNHKFWALTTTRAVGIEQP